MKKINSIIGGIALLVIACLALISSAVKSAHAKGDEFGAVVAGNSNPGLRFTLRSVLTFGGQFLLLGFPGRSGL